MKKKLVGLLLGAAVLMGLTACSEARAYPSECTYVVGTGAGDASKIKGDVLYPGETHSVDGDEAMWTVPCNARNYVTTTKADHGDRRETAVEVRTKATETLPSVYIRIETTANWSLNQNQSTLKEFLPFCMKYTCYTPGNNADNSGSNFASEGWNGMLAENFGPAEDSALRRIVSAQFDSSIVDDPAKWDELATALEPAFRDEIKKSWAQISDKDFFCGNGVETRTNDCVPVSWRIDNITFKDDRIAALAADSQVQQAQEALSQQQIDNAKNRYGDQWPYFLGMGDLIDKCKASGQACTIVLGSSGQAVAVPTSTVPTAPTG